MTDDDLLSRKAAAAYLQKKGCATSPNTLHKLAMNGNAGRGPPFTKYRKQFIRYRRVDLDAWAARELKRVE